MAFSTQRRMSHAARHILNPTANKHVRPQHFSRLSFREVMSSLILSWPKNNMHDLRRFVFGLSSSAVCGVRASSRCSRAKYGSVPAGVFVSVRTFVVCKATCVLIGAAQEPVGLELISSLSGDEMCLDGRTDISSTQNQLRDIGAAGKRAMKWIAELCT